MMIFLLRCSLCLPEVSFLILSARLQNLEVRYSPVERILTEGLVMSDDVTAAFTTALTELGMTHEDVFECVDRRIIRELVHMILHQAQNTSTIEQIIKGREMTFWWPTYRPFYKALEYALWLSDKVQEQGKISIADYREGFAKYTSSWYLIDQYYRRFIEYYRLISQNA